MPQPEQAREFVTTHFDKVLYTTKAHTTGGRDNGVSRTDDRRLGLKLSPPCTSGTGTNPEQLFVVGCSAIKLVAGKKKVTLPTDVAVDAEVDLGITHCVHGLASRLNVTLPGMDRETAQPLADAAHHVCPYSRATHGNINLTTNMVVLPNGSSI